MDAEELNKILARIKRLQSRLADKSGSSTAWNAQAPDGQTHHYIINGIKDIDHISDDVESLFVWLWSVKDYLKEYVRRKGKSEKWVEDQVNSDACLSVCADIANRAKHAQQLSKGSRSGKYPRLGKLRFTVPQQAMGQITVRAFEVEMDISNPTLVKFEMPILDERNRIIGEAFNLLAEGIQRWEELINEFEMQGSYPMALRE
jgi:hypothetical protein